MSENGENSILRGFRNLVTRCTICGKLVWQVARGFKANTHVDCWLNSDDDVAYGSFDADS